MNASRPHQSPLLHLRQLRFAVLAAALLACGAPAQAANGRNPSQTKARASAAEAKATATVALAPTPAQSVLSTPLALTRPR